MKKRIKILLVAGARPNFMKIAPIYHELKKHRRLNTVLVHTGQHYDIEMSEIFFKQLKMPKPNISLRIGSDTHAKQTGRIMIAFEGVCRKEKPDVVIVVGDVNSTLACALVAAKMDIPVAHVEAGLRSFDWTMPEEINRVLTDHVADFLFTTCEGANMNLRNEGIASNRIFFTGNVMIDTLLQNIMIAKKSNILKKLKLKENNKVKKYALVTLHRPSNVDDKKTLRKILGALNKIGQLLPILFPAHPRTMKNIREFNLGAMATHLKAASLGRLQKNYPKVLVFPPIGYLDFLCLMSHATVVLTDSGGIQEETTILGIPCLTLRHNTERPITIKQGTNMLVGSDPERIVKGVMRVLQKGTSRKRIPKYWDGKAAQKIVNILLKKL
jgi:UDP-N-acetylglucosamine 2-epimerase (non-hydrolysing)